MKRCLGCRESGNRLGQPSHFSESRRTNGTYGLTENRVQIEPSLTSGDARARGKAIPVADIGVEGCTCGKKRYFTKAKAKDAAKRLRGWGRMHPYRCGSFWHIGHMPEALRTGRIARDALRKDLP